MAFDFKKEYKDLYQPGTAPSILTVPPLRFLAVRGAGDPNEPDGAYQKALALLYGIAYTLKMSYKTDHRIDGYFEYAVPPLEGFWRQAGVNGMDYGRKADLLWISVIRLPDFVRDEDFRWAVDTATRKKMLDFSSVELLTIDEGLCVQCMHIGPYDDEPATVEKMRRFLEEQGYVTDFDHGRLHHEIYLSDPRRGDTAKLRTVIRHPIRKA